jgi:acyl-CoA oxidase
VTTALRAFLHGDRLAALAELDALLRAPEFAASTAPATHRERNLRTYARLAAVGRHEGGSLALAGHVRRMFTVQEWMAVVDPCVFHAALVHFAVCTWTIRELGRPGADLAELTGELDRQDAAGTILITEVGRSNSHIAVATEARYDAASRSFTLNTPDDGAVKVMANVAEPGVAKSAIVFAELVVGERRCGVFPFAMRIRTADGPAPGVRIAALSDVAAIPLDYALVRFDAARVPFDSWLCDSASLAADGTFTDPLDRPGERLVRSLAFSAHAALGASVGLAAAARASVTVALRHARQRVTSGTLAPGLEVLGYSTQQWALYTALADAVATTFLVEQAKTWWADGAPGPRRATGQAFAPWTAVNRGLALTKAAAAACLARVTAACRIGAGAQGLLAANRVAQYEGMAQVFQAAVGDSLLTRLDAGRSLVSDADYAVAVPRRAGPAPDFDDPRTAPALSAAREAGLLAAIRERIRDADADAETAPFDLWNPLLPATIELADAHLRNLTLQSFDARLAAAAAPEVVAALRPLLLLHGLNIVHEDLAWHLEHGSLQPGDVAGLRAARERALAHVHDHAAALVDAFAIPAERLQATIAEDDYVSAVARELDG